MSDFMEGLGKDASGRATAGNEQPRPRPEHVNPEHVNPEHADPEHANPEHADSGAADPAHADRGHAVSDQGPRAPERAPARPTRGGHPHGKRSSWTLATIIVVAFIVGGLALIYRAWWLFWVCAGVVILAIPVGKLIGMMDDTVVWGSTAPQDHPPGGGRES